VFSYTACCGEIQDSTVLSLKRYRKTVLDLSKEYKNSNKLFFTNVTKSTYISHRKNFAEHLDLPNTGIFYSNDVASD
jgi:hypothetical protein